MEVLAVFCPVSQVDFSFVCLNFVQVRSSCSSHMMQMGYFWGLEMTAELDRSFLGEMCFPQSSLSVNLLRRESLQYVLHTLWYFALCILSVLAMPWPSSSIAQEIFNPAGTTSIALKPCRSLSNDANPSSLGVCSRPRSSISSWQRQHSSQLMPSILAASRCYSSASAPTPLFTQTLYLKSNKNWVGPL